VSEIPWIYSGEESAELLGLAEQIARIGVIDWQVQTGKVRLSATAQSMYGLDNFDGRYATWIATVHRDDVVRLRDIIAMALAEHKREFELDFRIVRPNDGQLRWIHARRLVFYDISGTPFRVVGVSIDITERKQEQFEMLNFTAALEKAVKERTRELVAENEARKKAEELLRQAQKMEAVGQLTGGIAHDFNNLLTIVVGGLEMIGRQIAALPAPDATMRITRAKDMALHGARRAATLTSRLLAFSRQQALAPQTIDVNKLIANIHDFLGRTLGENVSLETVSAGGLWRTLADPNQLENALLNLAVNARDAMPRGGKLTIETSNSYLDQAYVASIPEPVQPGQYVMIAVADTGAGMDRLTRERAFDPFFTTKEVGKGTGLGLSQVYGFVRQTGGHVQIYSELGEGTVVKLYLPRHVDSDEPAGPTVQMDDALRAFGTETILVAEDDEALRGFTTDVLRELGYRVIEARDGPSALDVLESHHVDLLFTDVVMPGGMNGRELADEAVRRKPGLRVLFTTGYARNARFDAGVHMIGKPFSFGELSVKLRMFWIFKGRPRLASMLAKHGSSVLGGPPQCCTARGCWRLRC
jgi:PAS domain S-box-containing protein